jgi:ribosome-binding ATPase YchF (GTP1/OBG family)
VLLACRTNPSKEMELIVRELDLIIEGLNSIYYKKIKKLSHAPERNAKVNEELKFCQILTQKMMVYRNLQALVYDQKETDDSTGRSTPVGDEFKSEIDP